MHNLVVGGFTGRVYVVHPHADAVLGVPAYPTMGDIGDQVDLAIIALPAERVPEAAQECARQGVHGLVVVSTGFAEAARRAASGSASCWRSPAATGCAWSDRTASA